MENLTGEDRLEEEFALLEEFEALADNLSIVDVDFDKNNPNQMRIRIYDNNAKQTEDKPALTKESNEGLKIQHGEDIFTIRKDQANFILIIDRGNGRKVQISAPLKIESDIVDRAYNSNNRSWATMNSASKFNLEIEE